MTEPPSLTVGIEEEYLIVDRETRDLVNQRIRRKMMAVRFDFQDCVTDYERYLLQIDTQRTQCLEAANSRDSWYARAADRLGCEAEFIAGALAGEGQFISCTALGSLME